MNFRLPISEAISKAVQPFLAGIKTSAFALMRYLATAFFLQYRNGREIHEINSFINAKWEPFKNMLGAFKYNILTANYRPASISSKQSSSNNVCWTFLQQTAQDSNPCGKACGAMKLNTPPS